MSLLLPPQSVISLANIPLSSCVPISWQVLANRDPAGAVCKIDQICWPPSTTQTSAQGVTTMQIKKNIFSILPLFAFLLCEHFPSPTSCVPALCFSRLRSSTMDLVKCQMDPNGIKDFRPTQGWFLQNPWHGFANLVPPWVCIRHSCSHLQAR